MLYHNKESSKMGNVVSRNTNLGGETAGEKRQKQIN